METLDRVTRTSNLIKEKEAKGWAFAGIDGLKRTKLTPEARYIAEPFQTAEDIKQKTLEKYREQARQQGQDVEIEVELVPHPPAMFQGQPVVNKLLDNEDQLIFVRVKK